MQKNLKTALGKGGLGYQTGSDVEGDDVCRRAF
jgi:hypothetical protein